MTSTKFAVGFCLSILVAVGCSSSSPSGDAAAGAAGTGGSTGAGGSTDSGVAFTSIAPCTDATTYTTGATTVMTTADFMYSPACLKIAKGATITIQASDVHPLAGLTTGSADNPIPTGGKTTDQVVTFPAAGFFPYQCNMHVSIGMKGVVWVQ
jgi:plastocyanin